MSMWPALLCLGLAWALIIGALYWLFGGYGIAALVLVVGIAAAIVASSLLVIAEDKRTRRIPWRD